MRDFYKSKRFLVLVAVALAFIIIPVTLTAMGLGSNVRSFINIVLTPAQKLFTSVTDAFEGYTAYFAEFDRIAEENEVLKKTVAELREKIAKDDKLKEDYEWLCGFIELKREHTDFVMLDASVTGREAGNYITVFTIDRGTAHGVKVGMPAVTEAGVVGSVVEVGYTWAKVSTLLDPSRGFGGMIERTGEAGLITSDFIMTKENICKLSYLSADSDIREGDRVMTSGYGTVYPRALLIGTVKKVEADEFSQTLVAYIEPAADLSNLKRVMIITEYTVYTEDGGTENE